MSSRTKKIIAFATPVLVFATPLLAFGQGGNSGLVPCGTDSTNQCSFEDLIILANNVIDFLIFNLAAPLAGIVMAIAGIMMFTAGGNEAQLSKAKSIFGYVVIGILIALSAWLIVKAIVSVLIDPSFNLTPYI